MQPIIKNLNNLFGQFNDFINHISEEDLQKKLHIPSNTIASQLWCIVGARESHVKAILAGEWSGFTCSLDRSNLTKASIKKALVESQREFNETITNIKNLTDAQIGLMLDLLEHEAQHQGQLIRYGYGLKIGFPESWKDRWHL